MNDQIKKDDELLRIAQDLDKKGYVLDQFIDIRIALILIKADPYFNFLRKETRELIKEAINKSKK